MDAERTALAAEVEKRWRDYESGLPAAGLLARRDGSVREILDGNEDAFARCRSAGASTTLAEAQQRIVDSIQRMQESTLGYRAIVDLLLKSGRRRMRARGAAMAGLDARPLAILEVAAGSGWFMRHVWNVANQEAIPIALWAGDINPDFVKSLQQRLAAQDVPCRTTVADARHMTGIEDGAWDVAFMSYTLHHFAPADAALCLRELDRVSGGGLVVVDIARNLAGLAFGRVVYGALDRDGARFAYHDGMASVRRGYTARELELLLEWVGIRDRYRVGALPTWHPQRLIANAIWPV